VTKLTFSCQWATVAFAVTAFGHSINAEGTEPILPGGTSDAALEPAELAFTSPANLDRAQTKLLILSNRGPNDRTFTAEVIDQRRTWLSVSFRRVVPARDSVSIAATADSSALPPGFYTAKLRITFDDGGRLESVVTLAKSSDPQSIVVPRTGIVFQMVTNGTSVVPQSFFIQSGSGADLSWAAVLADQTNGTNWLSLSSGSGIASGLSGSADEVRVDSAGLTPGDYFQGIMIAADGVSNSPQGVTVMLRVLPEGTDIVPAVSPTGLLFQASATGTDPQSQDFLVTNAAHRSYTFTATASTDDGTKWLSVESPFGVILPLGSMRVKAAVDGTGLAPGSYQGQVTLSFPDLHSTATVAVVLAITPGSTPGVFSRTSEKAADCVPKKLIAVSTQLGSGFQSTAGWPSLLDAQVIDDCGAPMTSGAVSATFSSNEPPVSLSSVGNGRWVATWAPRAQTAQPVVITLHAYRTDVNIQGTVQIAGSIQRDTTTPTITAIGVGTADNLKPTTTLTAGSIVTIVGSAFNGGGADSTAAPCQTALAGSRVLLKSVQVPLCLVGPDEIRFVVPAGIPENTSQQLIVQNGSSVSTPTTVTIASADATDPAQSDGN